MKKSLTQSQILYYFLGPETRHWSTVAESQNLLTMYESWFASKEPSCQCIAKRNDFSSLYLFTFQLYIPCKRVDLLHIRESTMEQHSRNQESNSLQQLQSSMKSFQPLQIHKHLHWLQWIEELIDCKTKEGRLDTRSQGMEVMKSLRLSFAFFSRILLGRHKLSYQHTNPQSTWSILFISSLLMSLHPREFQSMSRDSCPVITYLRKKTFEHQ